MKRYPKKIRFPAWIYDRIVQHMSVAEKQLGIKHTFTQVVIERLAYAFNYTEMQILEHRLKARKRRKPLSHTRYNTDLAEGRARCIAKIEKGE